MRSKFLPWRPIFILFIILNAFFITGKSWLAKNGINDEVLIVGNLVLLIATALSFRISQRSIHSVNKNDSVRSLYGSFMIKFFICIIAAFVYIMVARKNINKPSLFICMGLYLVYTFIEVSALTKMLKEKKNA